MSIIAWALANWRLVAVVILVAALGTYGMTMRLARDLARAEVVSIRGEFNDYKMAVAEERAKAAKAALAKAIEDERKKEQADAENERERARLAADIKRLREQQPLHLDLPATRPGSSCPDGQACFDRAELQRAYRDLVAEVRQIADECTAMNADLDAAKRWALAR